MVNGFSSDIISAIAYFDVFQHPLKLDELQALTGLNADSISQAIHPEIDSNRLFNFEDFYSLRPNVAQLVMQRKTKEKRAEKYFSKLGFYSKIIQSFPFVKGVAISGSLSKGVMHEDGDIDYFIVTSANRLWVCRTLLILFKKVFLLNSRKYFCVNYFVDENNLKIQDENIFTAAEISHLVPTYNAVLFEQLKEENSWTHDYFKMGAKQLPVQVSSGNKLLKKWSEAILSMRLGDLLDKWFMKITCKLWDNKFKNFDAAQFELTMRSKRGISKHHPSDFQTKVLQQYEQRISQYQSLHESSVYA